MSAALIVNEPEYHVWRNMKQRCYNAKCASYEYYGGRGIEVCNTWRVSFWAFINDMGRRPSIDHQIDRIDNDGNYAPDNCRWATRSQQMLNRNPGDPIRNLKLDWNQVHEIRAIYPKLSLTQLGLRYSVSRSCIHDIVRKRTWKEECVS